MDAFSRFDAISFEFFSTKISILFKLILNEKIINYK